MQLAASGPESDMKIGMEVSAPLAESFFSKMMATTGGIIWRPSQMSGWHRFDQVLES